MQNNKYLKISIVIPTYNNAKILPKFFKYLKKQDYPKKYLEIIAVDGGSVDKTVEITKGNGAKNLKNPGVYADIGVSIGMKAAHGDIIMILAVDNFLNDKLSLQKMSQVFANKDILAAFPKHESDASDTFLTKYVNTFTDPFNHFVYQYAANARTFNKIYKTVLHTNLYDVYDFHSNKDRPLIAFAQGFTIRTGFLKDKKHEFDDLMPVIQIIGRKENIAFVHSVSLYHHTINSIGHFVKKQKWATKNYLERRSYGLYSRKKYLSKEQRRRIKIWPFYVASIVCPIVFSLYKLVKDREMRWLYHPIMCYISFYSSLSTLIQYNYERIFSIKKSR